MKRLLSSIAVLLIFLSCLGNCFAAGYSETCTGDVYVKYIYDPGEGRYTVQASDGSYEVTTDDGVHIKVSCSDTELPLVVHQMSESEKECYEWLQSCVSQDVVSFIPYDIYFLDSSGDRVELSPDAEITISKSLENESVLWLSYDGTATAVTAKENDNELVFKTTNTGGYYLTCEIKPKSQPEPVDSSKKFTDVEEGRWYKEYIDYAATYGLMNGMTETTFEPTTTLTRAMFVQIIANLSGVDTKNLDVDTQFTDVPAGKWFTPAVKWAADNGIVKGVSETEFKPNDPIQRQQMCVMLVRYTKYANITLTANIEKVQFSDDARIQDYAKEAVYACQQAGIIEGMDKETKTLAPRDSATRAQAATVITRFHKGLAADK